MASPDFSVSLKSLDESFVEAFSRLSVSAEDAAKTLSNFGGAMSAWKPGSPTVHFEVIKANGQVVSRTDADEALSEAMSSLFDKDGPATLLKVVEVLGRADQTMVHYRRFVHSQKDRDTLLELMRG